MQNRKEDVNQPLELSRKVFQNLEFDLRTLLNGFVGPIQLLKFKLDDPDLVEIFRLLDSTLYRLERLASRSNIVSKFELDIDHLSKRTINIVDVARYSIIELQTITDLENVKINIQPTNGPISLQGDYDLLLQVFEILLEHTISLSHDNSTVEVSFNMNDQQVVCSIYSPSATFSSEIGNPHYSEGDSNNLSWGLFLAISILQKHNASVVVNHSDGNTNKLDIIFNLQ
ncbi:MAG: hypothetical protein CVT98_08255 [Bacteroidetes bacterium HGW-Bacteroidetes-15]|nr:MAG: hypothetical protein CVT98_08255 [Bacteroidetes bacterium HGW-Bacteroidetes-15]